MLYVCSYNSEKYLASTIDDEQLDRIVSDLQRHYPNCGYRLLKGHLAAMGHRLQENRIRDSLRRIDPVGVMSRWIHTIQRRRYSVPGPKYVMAYRWKS